MTKWEYMTEKFDLGYSREIDEGRLSRYGEDGWELTAIVPYRSDAVIAYFKRPKEAGYR